MARYPAWNASTPRPSSTNSASVRVCALRSSGSRTRRSGGLIAERTSDLTEGWPEPDTDIVLLAADSTEELKPLAELATGSDRTARSGSCRSRARLDAPRHRSDGGRQGSRPDRQQGRVVLGEPYVDPARDPGRPPAVTGYYRRDARPPPRAHRRPHPRPGLARAEDAPQHRGGPRTRRPRGEARGTRGTGRDPGSDERGTRRSGRRVTAAIRHRSTGLTGRRFRLPGKGLRTRDA